MIIGIIIFFFLKDRDKMLASQIDRHGGMKQKYSELIEWLITEPDARIIKVARDHIQISVVMQTTATHFLITETFGCVEVEWQAKLGIMGSHKKKWKFDSATSNLQMIEKIGTDLNEYNRKLL